VIDGGGNGPVATFASGEGADAVLEGFTLRGGLPDAAVSPPGGGGIRCIGASPTIRGNVIAENTAYWYGGGILCIDSTARIEGNEIVGNDFECLLADYPCSDGGGIACLGGAPEIIRNRIAGNIASDLGGGIYCSGTAGARIEGNRIEGNGAFRGGGIAIEIGDAEIVNDLIVGNEAFGFFSLTGLIPGDGGGIHLGPGGDALVLNCTVLANDATGAGGGLSAVGQNPVLANAIVRGNTAAVSDSQITGSWSSVTSDVEGGLAGPGNFDADPLFVDGPAGPFYLSQIAAGQGAQSPCVDAGEVVPGIVVDGTTRTDEGPDLGAPDLGYHHPVLATLFVRGDCGADGATNIADPIFLLGALFPIAGAPPPPIPCDDACDANDDGTLTIADAVALLAVLFTPGTPPLAPPISCGGDGTADGLGCGLHPPCAGP
jgi:parallel beta-helix repeat protein